MSQPYTHIQAKYIALLDSFFLLCVLVLNDMHESRTHSTMNRTYRMDASPRRGEIQQEEFILIPLFQSHYSHLCKYNRNLCIGYAMMPRR